MSSSAYSAELSCDNTLRYVVLSTGALATIVGTVLILTLRIHPSLRLLACCGWLLMSGLELYKMRCAYGRFLKLRITACGDAWLRDRHGDWQAASLLPGSVLLRHVGWIRLAARDGTRVAEPLRGHCRRSAGWRRLQVVWRHIGAVPGSC